MQFPSILLALLSVGALATAIPTDASAAAPIPAPEAAAAPTAYCDKYSGRERRECEEQGVRYCQKFDGRERRECEDSHSRNQPPRYPGPYCRKFDGRERRECENESNYCNKFDGRERRDCNDGRGFNGGPGGYVNAPAWNGGNQNCNQYNGQCVSNIASHCRQDCERAQRDGFARPAWCYRNC